MKHFMITLICLATLVFAGCTEEQLTKTDEIVDKVQTATNAATTVVSSPAGALIPAPYRLPVSWALSILGAIAAAWQQRRKIMYKEKLWVSKTDLAFEIKDSAKYRTALAEVVDGSDQFLNDSSGGNDSFREKQNGSQSMETRQIIKSMKSAV